MSKNKALSQKGFTVVEIALLVVIVGLLAGIGWYVYDTNKNTRAALDNANKVNQQTNSPTSKGERYVFKDLGISIILSKELEGLSYRYESDIKVAYLYSPSFAEAFEKCYGEKSDPNIDSFGALSRGEGQYQTPSEEDLPSVPPIKQFDKFYISGSLPNGLGVCSQSGVDNELAFDTAKKLFHQVGDAVKTATLVE